MTHQSALTLARDALVMLQSKMTAQVNGADESCFIIGMRKQVSMSEMESISEALAAIEAELAAPARADERAAFEAYMRKQNVTTSFARYVTDPPEYKTKSVQSAWQIWQAAQEGGHG
jgi:hypothetical protein